MSDTERMREAIGALAGLEEMAKAWINQAANDRERRVATAQSAVATIRRALAVPEQAPETPTVRAWLVRREYHGGGYTEWLCQTEYQAREMARDSASLRSPDHVIPLYAAPAALPDGKDAERDALIAEFVRWWLDDEMDGAAYFNNVMRASPAAAKAMAAAIQAQTEGERAPSPASAVPQGGDAAANQGGER